MERTRPRTRTGCRDMRTKRQVLLAYGFNDKTFRGLITDGIVRVRVKPGKRPTVLVEEDSLAALTEGEHYVVCRECGARQFQMTSKHLRACSGTSLGEYRGRHEDAPIISAYCSRNKRKTAAQRRAQSERLRERFQTAEGDVTRRQISAASRRMQAGDYGEIAAEHLRTIATSQEGRERSRHLTRERWHSGDLRGVVEGWHRDNRGRSLASIAHARTHLRMTSTIHLRLKKALVVAGMGGFQTEYPVAWYHVDEADPSLKLALEVDGCYWHGCPDCGFEGTPRVRRIDRAKSTYLTRRGWRILRVREHAIRADLGSCVAMVRRWLDSASERGIPGHVSS